MIKKLFILCLVLSWSPLSYAQTAKWNEKRSTHFIIYYKNTNEDFINRVINYSEDYYNQIADNLGLNRFNYWLWDNRAKIYVFDNAQDYHQSTSQPGWAAGGTYVREKIIQTYPGRDAFFETVLPHELSHIIFREYVGLNNPSIPMWLDEGIAMYQEKGRNIDTKAYLRQAMREGSFMNVAMLSNYSPMGQSHYKQVSIFYVESLSIVSYLNKEFGKDAFQVFCQNLRDKRNLERALASAFNFSNLNQFDSSWQEYIKK